MAQEASGAGHLLVAWLVVQAPPPFKVLSSTTDDNSLYCVQSIYNILIMFHVDMISNKIYPDHVKSIYGQIILEALAEI